MRKALTLTAVVLLAASSAHAGRSGADRAADLAYTFDDYVREFGKVYHSREEYAKRLGIYERNVALARAHNADASQAYQLGVNQFADWTNDEFKRKRTGIDKDLFRQRHARGLKATYPSKVEADLPDQVDWRKNGTVTAVKDQGSCGSCWAFSSAETIESAVAIATKTLLTLSPQQLVSCSTNPLQCGGTGGCDGSVQPIAFNYTIQAGGLTTEQSYPYEGVTGTCRPSAIKPVAGITGQVDLPTNNYNALLTAVATQQPVAISLAAGSIAWQLYSGGVLTSGCNADIDHAVQLVGYGTADAGAYWLVRNSWGSSWGEEGYIRILRHTDGNTPCATDSKPGDGFGCKGGPATIEVCGLCGILSASSYVTGAYLVNSTSI